MNDKVKIIVAVACLAIAGAAVAWQMGLFGSSKPKGAANSAEFDRTLDEIDESQRNNNDGGPTIIAPDQPGGRSGVIIN
ncbi:MAG: hypothetical protein Tsb0013_14450 [Phycisphaerales bacterium]